jgi:hypothetical protein
MELLTSTQRGAFSAVRRIFAVLQSRPWSAAHHQRVISKPAVAAIPFGVCLPIQAQKPDQSPECLGHACPLLLCSRPVMA